MSHVPRNRKREEYLRQIGRPLLVEGPEVRAILARVRSFHARGMTYVQMWEQTGVHQRTIGHSVMLNRSAMRRSTFVRLSTLRFEEPPPHAWVSPVGVRRRLAALWVDGFPLPWLAERLDFPNRQYIQSLMRGDKGKAGIRYSNARSVELLYDKLIGSAPSDLGIDRRASAFARTFAEKKGAVPRGCWDEDTIDDPQAAPEWTGQCGTWIGARAHRRDGIPMCPACEPYDLGVKVPGFSPEKLRSLRQSRGLGRANLAEMVGVHESTIMYWEAGRSSPERKWRIDKLLSVLDATFEDVIEEAPSE